VSDAPSQGSLEVICGPMFAGKTTLLIQRIEAMRATGATVRVLRPARDTRSMPGAIQTHGGAHAQADEVERGDQLESAALGAQVVVIDEIHFFGASAVEPCLRLLSAGCRVIVAGVEIDHFGKPFEPFPQLLQCATSVQRLQGTCARCGAPSTHTQRLIPASDRIVAGGEECYEPRCAACFKPSRAHHATSERGYPT
jgi:thymidine kinase